MISAGCGLSRKVDSGLPRSRIAALVMPRFDMRPRCARNSSSDHESIVSGAMRGPLRSLKALLASSKASDESAAEGETAAGAQEGTNALVKSAASALQKQATEAWGAYGSTNVNVNQARKLLIITLNRSLSSIKSDTNCTAL